MPLLFDPQQSASNDYAPIANTVTDTKHTQDKLAVSRDPVSVEKWLVNPRGPPTADLPA
ncbi:MAG: hypothetical protein H5U02_10765 [Clostridia bacterium]|nr:hypothetical protein [Clostridia bacterium]